ncbi:tetratricopeptide repeat protein [Chitinophaga tropicalis]|nr:tetratricopeptide repeat protein [Chitinophaga tropicalis]
MAFLRKAQAHTAIKILETFIGNTDNKSSLPEALYWAGVASYFQNQRNAEALVPYWQKLLSDYPENVWAQRADCLNVMI